MALQIHHPLGQYYCQEYRPCKSEKHKLCAGYTVVFFQFVKLRLTEIYYGPTVKNNGFPLFSPKEAKSGNPSLPVPTLVNYYCGGITHHALQKLVKPLVMAVTDV